MIHPIPPHSMNCWSASTSAVTRPTNTPRFSSDCSAIDSAWMCENVFTRSCIIAFSAASMSRRPGMRAATNAIMTTTKPIAQIVYEDLLDQDGRAQRHDRDAERNDDRHPEAAAQLGASAYPSLEHRPLSLELLRNRQRVIVVQRRKLSAHRRPPPGAPARRRG